MLWIEHLLDAAPLEMREVAENVDKVSPGHTKQYRGPVHVNGDHSICPGWEV